MKLWVVFSSAVLLSMVSQETLSQDEVFFLKRQTEFWKDRDYGLMKKQIAEFFSKHPTSHIHDNLRAMLGDLLYQEGSYDEALAEYRQVIDLQLREKTESRRWQCLYLAGCYDELIQEVGSGEGKSLEVQFILADSMLRKVRLQLDVEVAARAKEGFRKLFGTPYEDKVMLPLAETHRVLGEAKEAAALYAQLAERGETEREDFLLQAAALQLEFDTASALATFRKIVDLGGEKASDAAYHELLLLFQGDQYAAILERKGVLEPLLVGERRKQLDFALARSYFKSERWPDAVPHLTRFIEEEKEGTPQRRSAFLMLIHCAKEASNATLVEETALQFLAAFPGDEEAGKALLVHAQMELQEERWASASKSLNLLLNTFPEFPDQEALRYDQAVLFYKIENWRESHTAFATYLETYPATPHAIKIAQSMVHCSIEELKLGACGKDRVMADLRRALALEKNEAYQFLLGQILFDEGRFVEAAAVVETASLAEARLLHVLCLRETHGPSPELIACAEKALIQVEEVAHQVTLHLHLFNAYLALQQHEAAAEHLYAVFVLPGSTLQYENKLWLAHYYSKTAQDRARQLFTAILHVDEAYGLHFDVHDAGLEAEVLHFAKLLTASERIKLLTSLVEIHEAHPHTAWKQQEEALLEIAAAYIELNRLDEALAKFDEVLLKEAPFAILARAKLEKSRLLLKMQADVEPVLSMLKDLQIQKSLASEPIHLEAALDYVALRAQLTPTATLFFLNRLKEDFNAEDDAAAQAYHAARLQLPEKDRLFQTYMQYVEAEILLWEGEEAAISGDAEKASHNQTVAAALLESIVQSEGATPYLVEKAKERLKSVHEK